MRLSPRAPFVSGRSACKRRPRDRSFRKPGTEPGAHRTFEPEVNTNGADDGEQQDGSGVEARQDRPEQVKVPPHQFNWPHRKRVDEIERIRRVTQQKQRTWNA